MLTRDFDYDLPEHLVARRPASRREDARLMVLKRETGGITHRRFRDLPDLLSPDDLLVLNNTRVIPARLLGARPPDCGKIEALLLRPAGKETWWAMVRPGKKIKKGDRLIFDPERLEAVVEAYGERGSGERLLRFQCQGDWWETLEEVGHTPLPPYILHARKKDALQTGGASAEVPLKKKREDLPQPAFFQPEEPEDRERYQTVFAGDSRESVAAPTAGLHFSPEIFEQLDMRGIEHVFLNLSVGAGTFLPIKTERVGEHPMHEERFQIPPATAARLNKALAEDRRVVCVGTTVVRALETAALVAAGMNSEVAGIPLFQPDEVASPPPNPGDAPPTGGIQPLSGWTRLLITPGFPFRVARAILTNFHLPRSTLLLLVSAFARRETILNAYRKAVTEAYRFYSYGDCMLIE